MQVSESHDYVNHAIIGGGGPIEMGISTSAEFFNILSSTLYRDQILAMVRETLCNAWDAHIEAGLTDTAIDITVDSQHFIIRDFGRAIHHDDMGPIYGVYGNSTKKNDGKQTGGFGLGCKSPFAYTDHFEVSSCHEGTKTIYQISKAAVQTEGKPAIVPIASFPTSETGLTVKIDVKSSHDQRRIIELVQRIAKNGEMLVKLNGVMRDRLGFDSAVRNFFIHRGDLIGTTHTICIRYGNVIYPVESSTSLQKLQQEIADFLRKLQGINCYPQERYLHILFQAPPHSLSVTPSRESLSMQEHTIKTLERIYTGFLASVQQQFTQECDTIAQQAIEEAVTKKAYPVLLKRERGLPFVEKFVASSTITDFKSMAQFYLSHTYPKDIAFRKADWKCRTLLMIENKMIDLKLGQSFLKELDTVNVFEEDAYFHSNVKRSLWLTKHVMLPLVKKILKDSTMSVNQLYIVDHANLHKTGKQNSDVIPVRQVALRHLHDGAAYLRNIIVLSRRKSEIHDRCLEHETFKQFGRSTGFLFYHVGPKAVDAENARVFFAKTGLRVVDMIERQDWEPEPTVKHYVSKADAAALPPTRKKGLVKVSAVLAYDRINTKLANATNNDRIAKPEYIVRIYTGENVSSSELGFINNSLAAKFAEIYGERGGISTNTIQYSNYIQKGALPLRDFFVNEVVAYVNANFAEISRWWSLQNRSRFSPNSDEGKMLEFILGIPELRECFQLNPVISKISLIHAEFYHYLHVKCSDTYMGQPYTDLKNKMSAIKMTPELQSVVDKISGNPLVRLFDCSQLKYRLGFTTDKKLAARLVSVITTLLN